MNNGLRSGTRIRGERALAIAFITIGLLTSTKVLHAQQADVHLNLIVTSGGNLADDGKGAYSTGADHVIVWLNPDRYPRMSFNICTAWSFAKTPGVPVSGQKGARTLKHDLRAAVAGGGGKPLGVFDNSYGNDIGLSKPLTATVPGFRDIAVGTSLSPDSTEIRFCNADCSEYYSLIFGAASLFYPDLKINGSGTTKPTVLRTSATTWNVSFPAKTIGRLWRRSGELSDLGLYYYSGTFEIQKQQ